jgi:GT2 family glycosyltransferase
MDNGSHAGAADIIVPVHNEFQRARALLEDIYRFTEHPFHLYVIDNDSSDETAELDKIYCRDITIARNRERRPWSAAINQGIQLSRNRFLVFLETEVRISRGWLSHLIAFLETHPRIAAVGPLTSDPAELQWVDRVRGKIVPQIPEFLTPDLHERNRILGYHFHHTGVLTEESLGLFCVALKRRAVDETGLLDEAQSKEGAGRQYCLRLRKAGYVLGLSLDTYVVRSPVSH